MDESNLVIRSSMTERKGELEGGEGDRESQRKNREERRGKERRGALESWRRCQ